MTRHSELSEKTLCHLQWEVLWAVLWEDLWEVQGAVLWAVLWEDLWEVQEAVLMEDQVAADSLIHLVQWEMEEVQEEVQWVVLVEVEWISHL
jgi:hypothetical protein